MKKTVLYDEHLKHEAKIVEFADFLMPIEYKGISLEHQAVRERCGLFDVSHMGEIVVKGKDTVSFVNYIITNDISLYPSNKMIYGMLLNESGGVLDDLMVYKYSDDFCLLVVNASNLEKDYQWIMSQKGGFDVEVTDESNEYSQLALQGPLSHFVLQRITDYDLATLKLFDFNIFKILDKEYIVSRSGYTGEDGFEIYGSNSDILVLFKKLVDIEEITLCGLGCRDTLRFEAAMPLYGHELSEDINPLEIGLSFGIKLDKDFIGRNALIKAQEEGFKTKLVGLEMLDKGIARQGYEVEKNGEVIGHITTGYKIPNTNNSYALAILDRNHTKLGSEVFVRIRKNKVLAKIRNKKFLEKKYIR